MEKNWTSPVAGQVPSKEQVDGLSAELSYRGKELPGHVHKVLAALPAGTHPMTQFSIAVLALQVIHFPHLCLHKKCGSNLVTVMSRAPQLL